MFSPYFLLFLFGITEEVSFIICVYCDDCKWQLCFEFVVFKGMKFILFICGIYLVYLLTDGGLLCLTVKTVEGLREDSRI